MNGESTVVPKTEIPPFKYDKNEDNKNKKKEITYCPDLSAGSPADPSGTGKT